MYTGRWYDTATGLYDYRFRMYDPTLGRFLQPDPIGYADGINWYAYCGNNPINWIDPWGLLGEKDHEYYTRRAMKKVGFSEIDIDAAVKANINEDRLSNQRNNPAHYMPGSQAEAEALIKEKLKNATDLMNAGKTAEAMEELGKAMHTVQDKYPHQKDGSWGNHAKGLLPFVPSPDDNIGDVHNNSYKDTKKYLQDFKDAMEGKKKEKKK